MMREDEIARAIEDFGGNEALALRRISPQIADHFHNLGGGQ